ncbi:MFS transporter [Salinispora cortesiana]|uniref:MFS transporter n=1 Tax=Salinispora cortesiana TaxID=1305843 RepID=UPI000423FCFA|nr:MFS transporter [Salinispora cortesiana]
MRTVLRRPDFRLLFGGLVASMTAESILLLALAIWVKELTGSSGLAGATIFAIIAPMTLAPLVGWIVDRYPRRPLFVAANLVTAALLTPLFAVEDRTDLWLIYLVAIFYGLAYITLSAGLSGLLRHLVPAELLADANGALQTVRQGLRLIGPLAGAALYTAVGGGLLAGVAIVGFVAAAVLVGLLRVTEPPRSRPGRSCPGRRAGGARCGCCPPGPAQPSSPARRPRHTLRWSTELGAGLRYLADEPALRRALLGYGLGSLVMGFSESLIFAYVDHGLRRDAAFVGVLVTVQGVGGLAGGLVSSGVIRRVGEVGALAVGVALFGSAALTLAYPNLWLGCAALLLAGVSLPLTMVGLHTLIQRRTPAPLIGRVAAGADAVVSGPRAVSIGGGALLVSVFDYRLLFVVVGLVTLLASSYLWGGRRLSPPAQPAPVGPVPVRRRSPTGAP